MRICRVVDGMAPVYGVVKDDEVFRVVGNPYERCEIGEPMGMWRDLTPLAPCAPSKVVCVGRNFRALLAEQGREVPSEPYLFLKGPNAVVGPRSDVYCPAAVSALAHEGELAVIMAKTAQQLRPDDVFDAVWGYTCANDITVRDWQDPGRQWVRAKSCDSHCPVGPWVETDLEAVDDVRVRTMVNDEVRQDGRTSDMVFSIPQLVSYISDYMTLLPGDVILTGTSAGIRPIQVGDVVTVEVEGIGELTNRVAAWPARVG